MNPNRIAFLDMIARSEGTAASPLTQNMGYDVIVSGPDGPEIFSDYSDHPFANGSRPPKLVRAGLYSTASGRYQIMLHDWPHYKAQLKLQDFGPESQDTYAIQIIGERRALPLIDAGDFDAAVNRVANLWASLAGATYGQPTRSIDWLRTAYINAGGVLA